MDAGEVLKQAWAAVESAGIPEALHEPAFREAIRLIEAAGVTAGATNRTHEGSTPKQTPLKKAPSKAPPKKAPAPGVEIPTYPEISEDEFFATLATESDVDEAEIRQVLQFANGAVHVLLPTKRLGGSAAQQARTVIALVGGARFGGFGEKPVSLEAVRAEVDRKNCYQQNNFAHGHIGAMKQFNLGVDKSQLLIGPKWHEEFDEAVGRVIGRTD